MIKLFLGLLYAFSLFASTPSHIVLLGDPHLPGKHLENKERVLETLNQWSDVEMVVALGDLCSQTGTQEEYATVKNYFSKLKHPLLPITGNHDFIYEDVLDENGKLKHATVEIQMQKLETFKQTLKLLKLYYTLHKEPYMLIFLSADNPKHLAELSKEQLAWFENELKTHTTKPTIVFFHAPLEDTLETYKHWVNTPNFVAQPVKHIKSIIAQNPQIFLWVSGHTHTSPLEPSFDSAINLYENRVVNIHNTDMNKENIWTNSLFLYPDKVLIKTYNHTTNMWLDTLERTFFIPKF